MSKKTERFRRNGPGVRLAGLAALVGAGLIGGVPSVVAQTNVDGAVSLTTGASGTVLVENIETGIKRSVKTDGMGSARVAGLPPGSYKLTFTDAAGKEVVRYATVAISSTYPVSFVEAKDAPITMESVQVSADVVRPIDYQRPEVGGIQINAGELAVLPVGRDITSIALLAPGTVQGDSAFSGLPSIGGASAAENAYFVNGFNISNFRNGLSPSDVPFEFYENFDVQTGSVSAKYGRFDGGVTATTVKSGTNQFHADSSVYWRADALRELAEDIPYTDTDGVKQLWRYYTHSYYDSRGSNVAFSGPLLKNKVFFYGLYNDRLIKDDSGTKTVFSSARTDSPFYALNVDAYPLEGQSLQFTFFRNSTETTTKNYYWNYETGAITSSGPYVTNTSEAGGDTMIGTYRGAFLDDRLHVTLMGGKGEQNRNSSSDKIQQKAVYDLRYDSSAYATMLSGAGTGTYDTPSWDQRKAYRAEVSYNFDLFGGHNLMAGYDLENNVSVNNRSYSGGVRYILRKNSTSRAVSGVTVAANTPYVQKNIYFNSGKFEVNTDDQFIEDTWSLPGDRLTFRLGLRNESFENLNGLGQSFINIEEQLAPRLAATYDLFGDKKTKLVVGYARYFLPVASNTNMRLAGAETANTSYYYLTGLNTDNTPILGSQIGVTSVTADGSVHDARTIVASNIEPMYQDEFQVAIEHELTKRIKVTFGAKARDLATAMDDMFVDHALAKWALRNGYTQAQVDANVVGSGQYVLGNPGKEMKTYWDFDGDGDLEEATLTAADLGYPEAKRKYYEAYVSLDRKWDGKWSANASYTWSHTYGNSEGWLLSDIGQSDAGLTQSFDTPALTMNTYGDLPTDRRHSFKAHGSYAFTKELTAGLSSTLTSGRTIEKIGYYSDADMATATGSAYTYGASYLLAPRGSLGTTPWVFRLNASLTYTPKWVPSVLKDKVSFKATVYNVLDRRTALRVSPYAELDSAHTADPTYGLPTERMAPRYVELSAHVSY